ncbi:TetR/AcrR family transcriptional regulator [Virgibacillus soli]|uniref:TetR/AcrR family transcriptional regulator n=1 Tax=Paracerasibacillus soli TaxID=480284 RepID=A0ABU5CQ42_9BACI|nr:TetR/AcrR family transcriptional regulator [Virgibacillus soli]MDY0407937.1 TetR/AcrR family transcriptional regulator [Virgibacillus soli]
MASYKKSLGRPRANDLKKPTEQTILEAATSLFLNQGYQEVSIDEVASKAHVTKATVYYYYASKADLFTESMVQMMYRIQKQIDTVLNRDEPLQVRLKEITKAHLQATVHIDMNGFMRETRSALTKEQIQSIQQAEENMYSSIEIAIQNAIQKNEIPHHIHPKFVAHTYIALLQVGNYRNANNEPIFSSVDKMVDQILQFFWNGLDHK